jgi:hypothetical protein
MLTALISIVLLVGFLFVLVLFLFLFFNSPYRDECLMGGGRGAVVGSSNNITEDLFVKNKPSMVCPSVKNDLNVLLLEFHSMCEKQGIQFWLTKSSLLGLERSGELLPWNDIVTVCVEHSDLAKLVQGRMTVEVDGRFLLESHVDGYRLSMNNFARFPYVEINIMKRTDIELLNCCPLSELGECSFGSSYSRRNEIFSLESVYPLVEKELNLNFVEGAQQNQRLKVKVPQDAHRCLNILYGEAWQTEVHQKPTVRIDNHYSKSLLRRFFYI